MRRRFVRRGQPHDLGRTGCRRCTGEEMLSHQRQRIMEPLTHVPHQEWAQALQNFRNILGWMGDRPVTENRRSPLAFAIVHSSRDRDAIRDETFVQLIKQLTHNPSRKSRTLGWKLMVFLCDHIYPGGELIEYVRCWLTIQKEQLRFDPSQKECHESAKTALQRLSSEAIEKQRQEEADENALCINVHLMDDGVRKMKVNPTRTLGQISQLVGHVLDIKSGEQYCFFQLTDGLDVHRLLPETVVVMDIFEKFSRMFQQTKRFSRLVLFKFFLKI